MNSKLLSKVIIVILLAIVFMIFVIVVNAKSANIFCSKEPNIIITLKNDANVDISRDEILKIPQIKILKIRYRDKEWSKMVNKMDLPNMQNPFKNEIIIKTSKNVDTNEVYNKIEKMDFVDEVKYLLDTKCIESK